MSEEWTQSTHFLFAVRPCGLSDTFFPKRKKDCYGSVKTDIFLRTLRIVNFIFILKNYQLSHINVTTEEFITYLDTQGKKQKSIVFF